MGLAVSVVPAGCQFRRVADSPWSLRASGWAPQGIVCWL